MEREMVGMRQCGENNCKVRFLSCSKALYAVLKECCKETVYKAYHT